MTILSFLGGGLAGGLAYRAVGTGLLLGCAALLLVIALRQLLKATSSKPGEAARSRLKRS